MSIFSAVFLFRDYLVPLTIRYCLVLYFCYRLVGLASGSFIASYSSTAVYSCVSPIYIVVC
ncbi:uncharacterized protein K441DRAFT_664052, partial [Cenococcum geophilum 1.58]|uniref:uncharacterized protein n=1 Tax=Cenococcum geophilum 1.58 TaxID=794803 RepID=UPI00358DFD7B